MMVGEQNQLTEVREEDRDESYPQTQRTGGTADLIRSKCNSVNHSMAKKNSSHTSKIPPPQSANSRKHTKLAATQATQGSY